MLEAQQFLESARRSIWADDGEVELLCHEELAGNALGVLTGDRVYLLSHFVDGAYMSGEQFLPPEPIVI